MRTVLCVLLTCLASTHLQQEADPKADLERLEGTWKVVVLEVDGKAQPEDKSPKQIVITGSRLTGIGPEMTIRLDPAKKPKWVDLTFKKGEKEYPIRAIYDVVGDELTLCIPLAMKGKGFENKRPEKLESGKSVACFKAKRASK